MKMVKFEWAVVLAVMFLIFILIYSFIERASIKNECFKSKDCKITQVGNQYFYEKDGKVILKENIDGIY